jgi:hypothetical protein
MNNLLQNIGGNGISDEKPEENGSNTDKRVFGADEDESTRRISLSMVNRRLRQTRSSFRHRHLAATISPLNHGLDGRSMLILVFIGARLSSAAVTAASYCRRSPSIDDAGIHTRGDREISIANSSASIAEKHRYKIFSSIRAVYELSPQK